MSNAMLLNLFGAASCTATQSTLHAGLRQRHAVPPRRRRARAVLCQDHMLSLNDVAQTGSSTAPPLFAVTPSASSPSSSSPQAGICVEKRTHIPSLLVVFGRLNSPLCMLACRETDTCLDCLMAIGRLSSPLCMLRCAGKWSRR